MLGIEVKAKSREIYIYKNFQFSIDKRVDPDSMRNLENSRNDSKNSSDYIHDDQNLMIAETKKAKNDHKIVNFDQNGRKSEQSIDISNDYELELNSSDKEIDDFFKSMQMSSLLRKKHDEKIQIKPENLKTKKSSTKLEKNDEKINLITSGSEICHVFY